MAEGVVRELTTVWGFNINLKPMQELGANIFLLKESLEAVEQTAHKVFEATFGMAAATASYGREISESSQFLGISTDKFQAYQAAAKMAGVDQEKFMMGMNRLQQTTTDAAFGNEEAISTLGYLGIHARDASGQVKDLATMTNEVSSALKNMKNVAERNFLGEKLLGQRNYQMINFLKDGPQGLAKWEKMGKSLGFIMNEDQIERANKFYISMEKTKFMLAGIKNEIGFGFMGPFQKDMDNFMLWFQENSPRIKNDIDSFGIAFGKLMDGIGMLSPLLAPYVHFLELLEDVTNMIAGKRSATGDILNAIGAQPEDVMGKIGNHTVQRGEYEKMDESQKLNFAMQNPNPNDTSNPIQVVFNLTAGSVITTLSELTDAVHSGVTKAISDHNRSTASAIPTPVSR